jgi:hypothetical protein
MYQLIFWPCFNAFNIANSEFNGRQMRVLAMYSTVSRQARCEDATRTIFAKMFPHLFPFGRGHLGEHRSVPVSLRECIKYYTTLRSRRFAEDELFVLVASDRIAMQNMYSQTSFRCQRFPQLFDGYETIETDSLAKVLLNNERRCRGGSTSRGNDDTVVDRFLKTVDIASCAVWG